MGAQQEAESALRKTVELNPSGTVVHYWLSGLLLRLGKPAEAFAAIKEEPDSKFRDESLSLIVDTDEQRVEADRALVEVLTRYAASGAYQIANAYAIGHDPYQCFAWLDRAFHQHDGGLLGIRYNPGPGVKADRRFKDLLRKMNLSE